MTTAICIHCGVDIQYIKVRRPRSVCVECRRLARNDYQKYWHHIRLKKEKKPVARSECAEMGRPCVWISCKHHMLWIFMSVGIKRDPNIRMTRFLNSKSIAEFVNVIDKLIETCTFDVADKDGQTLENVAEIMGTTRERVRQIEENAIIRLRHHSKLKMINDFREGL